MTTGTMKVGDILRYSVKIENESMKFYRDAVKNIKSESVKSLVVELEMEELKHEARLADILASIDGDKALDFDKNSLDKMIQNREIPTDANEETVLNIALEREKNTRDFYNQVLTITNLDANVVDLFQMLFEQESGHVTRVNRMLEKL